MRGLPISTLTSTVTSNSERALSIVFFYFGRIKRELIQPGSSYQNGFSEAFNARLNDERLQTLDLNLFPLKDIQNRILF